MCVFASSCFARTVLAEGLSASACPSPRLIVEGLAPDTGFFDRVFERERVEPLAATYLPGVTEPLAFNLEIRLARFDEEAECRHGIAGHVIQSVLEVVDGVRRFKSGYLQSAVEKRAAQVGQFLFEFRASRGEEVPVDKHRVEMHDALEAHR